MGFLFCLKRLISGFVQLFVFHVGGRPFSGMRVRTMANEKCFFILVLIRICCNSFIFKKHSRVWDKKILILGILYYKFLKSID